MPSMGSHGARLLRAGTVSPASTTPFRASLEPSPDPAGKGEFNLASGCAWGSGSFWREGESSRSRMRKKTLAAPRAF